MTARLSHNLDVSNCLQWAELSGRLWAVNRRIMHSGESKGSPFSLLSSLLFRDIPHCGVKTDYTKLNSESIIRAIYQLGSLYSINKHITAFPCPAPRDIGDRLNIQSGDQGTRAKTWHRSETSVILSLSLAGKSSPHELS